MATAQPVHRIRDYPIRGFLASDFTVHTETNDTKARAEARLGLHRFSKENDGWYSDDPIYTDLKLFGRLAISAAQTLQQGDEVVGTGVMELSNYQNKDNKIIPTFEVVADPRP